MSWAAAVKFNRSFVFEYGAKSTKATLVVPSRTTPICPGSPAWAMPAARSAAVVSAAPWTPKSWEWLFAAFSTVKPAARYTAVRRGHVERVALGRGGRALGGRRRGHRALEIAKDDRRRQRRLDGRHVRRRIC